MVKPAGSIEIGRRNLPDLSEGVTDMTLEEIESAVKILAEFVRSLTVSTRIGEFDQAWLTAQSAYLETENRLINERAERRARDRFKAILSAYTLQDSMSPDNLLSLSKLLFPEIARILELEIGHRVIFISPLDGLITRGEVSETPTIVGLSSNPTNLPATGRDICPNISLKIGHQDINLGNHGSIIGLITDKETAVERLETLAKKVSTKDAVAFFELLDAIKLVFSDDSIADESEFIGLSGVVKSNIVENLLDSPSDINQDDQPEGKPWGIMKPNIDFNPRLYRVIESHLPDLFALIQQGITSYLSSRSHGLDYGSNDSVFRFIQSEIMIEEGISDMSGLKEETLNFLGERISQRTERYRLGKFYNPIKTTLP